MAFLTEEELDSLQIEQSVFHIVGPGEEHFKLLAAFDASPHASFFLGRVRSVNIGNRYQFLKDASVRAQLARINDDGSVFQEESENLARAFNSAHGGSTSVGAFLIFSLNCSSGRVFALLKFEDERVLSYTYDAQASGGSKPRPTFGVLDRTFVQNRNALQKAALVKLREEGDEICVVDRQNPQRPAAYFEQFLLARRQRTEQELTETIVDLTRKVALKHRENLTPDIIKNLSRRLYDASQSGGTVEGENARGWLHSVLGPLRDDNPVVASFEKTLKREGMTGESFVLNKDAIQPPRNRRVETEHGIKLTFPARLTSAVVSINEEKGEITIRDKITVDELDSPTGRKHP